MKKINKISFLIMIFLISISSVAADNRIDELIEESEVLINASPFSIKQNRDIYEIRFIIKNIIFDKFNNVENKKINYFDTLFLRIDYSESYFPQKRIDCIKDQLLFLKYENNELILTEPYCSYFEIDKYNSWDFEEKYINNKGLDTIFTYGFNELLKGKNEVLNIPDSVRKDLGIDSTYLAIHWRKCHYVFGLRNDVCYYYAGEVYPENLLIEVFNSPNYRDHKKKFKIIPYKWLVDYIHSKVKEKRKRE